MCKRVVDTAHNISVLGAFIAIGTVAISGALATEMLVTVSIGVSKGSNIAKRLVKFAREVK